MQRFHREAETVAQLHHTNIVPIFAVGGEHGVHYYAMQFIEGRSLADVIAWKSRCDHGSQTNPSPDPRSAIRWPAGACRRPRRWPTPTSAASSTATSSRRTCCSTPNGRVWLTDFGLATRADEVTLTVSRHAAGHAALHEPRAGRVAQRGPIDHRTDIYSLGATLYELATGRPVFEAETPHGVIRRILGRRAGAAPRQVRRDLPRDLETIILKCLAKDPARRYATAAGAGRRPPAVLDGRPILARRAGPVERAMRWVPQQLQARSSWRPRPRRRCAAGRRTTQLGSAPAGKLGGSRAWHIRPAPFGGSLERPGRCAGREVHRADAGAGRSVAGQVPRAAVGPASAQRDVRLRGGQRLARFVGGFTDRPARVGDTSQYGRDARGG